MTGERVYKEVPLSALLPNPWNPRKSFEGQKFNDLVESIRAKGVLEPILVRPVTDLAKKKDKDRKEFQIVAGERRWRAAREAGLDPRAFLARNDSWHFFDRVGGLLRTGPTGTNVCDIQLLAVV